MKNQEILQKMCSKCLTRKPIADFHTDKHSLGGVKSVCKECACKKARESREKNKEEISARAKEKYQEEKEDIKAERKKYYEQNRDSILERRKVLYHENREEINRRNRECYDRNKEVWNARRREYYLENKEKISQRDKEYRTKYPEVKRNYNQSLQGKWTHYKATAKRRGLPFELTFDEFSSFWQKPCHYCGCEVDTICLDRVDSSKGYTLDNVVPSCVDHNLMKLDHTEERFIELCKSVVKHFEEPICECEWKEDK